MSVNEVVATGICDKFINVQRICKDGDKAVPTSGFERIELSHDVEEANRKNAKPVDRVTEL